MNSQISSIVIGLLWGLVTSIQTSAQHLNDRNFGISEQGGRGQQENVPALATPEQHNAHAR